MQAAAVLVLLILAGASAGCVAPKSALVLAPADPPPAPLLPAHSPGLLIVYSAYDQHAHFDDPNYARFYTDYRVFSKAGDLLKIVHNNQGRLSPEPEQVSLPAGEYRIVARANGYGPVSLCVPIQAGKVTLVNLASDEVPARTSRSHQVALPDGRIVGWCTEPDTAAQTASCSAGQAR